MQLPYCVHYCRRLRTRYRYHASFRLRYRVRIRGDISRIDSAVAVDNRGGCVVDTDSNTIIGKSA
jgi:hypothetical protein